VRTALASLVVGLLVALAAVSASPAASAQRAILDVGDSLSIGAAPHLRSRLPGYRIARVHDVGLHAYDAADLVAARVGTLPPVLVVSAGTNDDPRIVTTFRRAVTRVVELAGPGRCVVWPTIVRPPAVGASYDGFNRVLRRVAARHESVVLVDWVGLVRSHPRWLSRDGVHVSPSGYEARASAIARAVRTQCAR
jgi:lysophospholipase L1-like esterase